MPRITATVLDNRLAAQITAVGYLVGIDAPGPSGLTGLKLCDIGTIVNGLGTWTAEDFSVKGADTERATLEIQNLNGAAGALVLEADPLAEMVVTIYQFERGAPESAVLLGIFGVQAAEVGLATARLALRALRVSFTFAPSKRITARDGFKYAMRPGEILLWGAQRIIVEEGR